MKKHTILKTSLTSILQITWKTKILHYIHYLEQKAYGSSAVAYENTLARSSYDLSRGNKDLDALRANTATPEQYKRIAQALGWEEQVVRNNRELAVSQYQKTLADNQESAEEKARKMVMQD